MPPDFFHTSKYMKTYYFKMRMKTPPPATMSHKPICNNSKKWAPICNIQNNWAKKTLQFLGSYATF